MATEIRIQPIIDQQVHATEQVLHYTHTSPSYRFFIPKDYPGITDEMIPRLLFQTWRIANRERPETISRLTRPITLRDYVAGIGDY